MPHLSDGLDSAIALRNGALPLAEVSAHRTPVEFRPAPPAVARRRAYVPVPAKYAIAMIFAIAWLLFSIWVSQPWMEDLGSVTHPMFAVICLTFIAYAPGFMNAFMILSLLMDRRPARIRQMPIRRFPS